MRKHVKEIGKFFVFVAIFFALTSPFVVLFGPFDNLKRTVVGAILKSRHPQYITWLFSQEEIDEILGGISSTPKQELFSFLLSQPLRPSSFIGIDPGGPLPYILLFMKVTW